jgi:hypothetical protein
MSSAPPSTAPAVSDGDVAPHLTHFMHVGFKEKREKKEGRRRNKWSSLSFLIFFFFFFSGFRPDFRQSSGRKFPLI